MTLADEGLAPRICCLDLDTFFVSVERVLDPSLEGKAVIVGGMPGQRGVVSACSYEVRRLGVRSGMSLNDAGRLAPDAIYLPVRHDTYGRYAAQVREIVARYAPEIQVASIDEMYMSLAGCERLYQKPGDVSPDATILRVVREMTATIKSELGLPASVGIACAKTMAKVASGLAKPAGVMMVRAEEAESVLAPLPVRKLPGIGPVAERKLNDLGITTLGQLAEAPVAKLRPAFGAWAEGMKLRARGEGTTALGAERPAFREHDPEGGTVGSISNERTFSEDVGNPEVIESMLCGLAERVAWRARSRGVVARTVTLKLRYANFQTLTHGRTIAATASEREIYRVVRELYREARTKKTRIRLLGVALSNLEMAEQLSLFPAEGALSETVDDIRARFGYDAVRLAPSVASRKRV